MSTLAVSQIEDLAGSAKVSIGGVSPALTFETSSVERFKVDDSGNISFNSGYGSSAVAYGCRAWVNFNGQGTVAIRDSGNVSSITDNATGDYTVNFTTAMPDANYTSVFTSGADMVSYAWVHINVNTSQSAVVAPTTSAMRSSFRNPSNAAYDPEYINAAFFR